MIIKEYRVVLPLTVEEYQVAQLHCVAEASRDNTGGGEGIEVIKNEPFDDYALLNGKFCKGQYTYKIYHLASKVPAFIRLLAPKGSLEIHEEAWNAYPYCRTVISNPGYMKECFYIVIESYHIDDDGQQENVHGLDMEKLKQREVVQIDIACDEISSKDYNSQYDPTLFHSVKANRGPLRSNWKQHTFPIMCCYKLVTCEFKWFGLQNRIEDFIHRQEKSLFFVFHRQLVCTMDKWYGLTMSDIRELEDKVKKELDELREKGSVKGYSAE